MDIGERLLGWGTRAAATACRDPRWAIVAALAAVLGAKLALIGVAGSATPFWDQWDGEADRVFIPWLNHQLRLVDLLRPHNEHRVVLTKIVALVLLEICGQWNTLAEMVFNAVCAIALLAMLILMLRRAGLLQSPMILCFLLLLLFAVPIGVENTLWGFQSQFTLLAIFSLGAIFLLYGSQGLAWRWWLGLCCTALSFLSMASGALTPVAALIVAAVQMVVGVRARSVREVGACAILLAVTCVMIAMTPVIANHQVLRAHGLFQFVLGQSIALGWPLPIPVFAPLIVNAPAMLLAYDLWRRRPPISDIRWRLLALIVWVLIQAAALGYARARSPFASRYTDLLSLIPLLNLAALQLLRRNAPPYLESAMGQLAAAVWLPLIAAGATVYAMYIVPRQPLLDAVNIRAQTANVRGYVTTHAPALLKEHRFIELVSPLHIAKPETPIYDLPYPDEARLRAWLDQTAVRGMLPPQFGATAAERHWVRSRLRLHGGLRIDVAPVAFFARWAGTLLMAMGLAALALIATVRPRADDCVDPPSDA